MKKAIKLLLSAGLFAGTTSIALADGAALYKTACFACHDAGVAGAPKFGDKAAWASRMGTGVDAITKVVITGKGAMPPKGGTQMTDAQIREVVEYMVNAVK